MIWETAYDLMQAFAIGGLITAVAWTVCHRGMYSWRDYTILVLLLLSVLVRNLFGTPPASHMAGILTLNLTFAFVAFAVLRRPSRIPKIDRRNKCLIPRLVHGIFHKRVLPEADSLQFTKGT